MTGNEIKKQYDELTAQFKNGEIPKNAYKKRLKELLDIGAGLCKEKENKNYLRSETEKEEYALIISTMNRIGDSLGKLRKWHFGEKHLNILGVVLLLIGIIFIILGVSLMMNSAQANNLSETTYGVMIMVGLLGGVFAGAYGIAILARNSSAPVRKGMDDTTKAMVKGAVVGGIIGGDAGAVVGAMIGKEKANKK